MTGAQDRAFMSRALFLAERGRGRTTPNPVVGAVVVTPDGVVAGQGAHLVAGGPHAEVVALDAAGAKARGATVYCTLEPCCHHGRTGPCVERLVAAGVARVVVAAVDPNPQVAGAGIAFLRAHGVSVAAGVGGDEAARQNAPFFRWVTAGRPFVIVKAALSADGFAGRPDRRVVLTGARADQYFQQQRAGIDAIAAGASTVLIDDPLLTARGAYRRRPLTRVLFDWRGRIPPSARVCSTVGSGPVIMVVSAAAAEAAPSWVASVEALGVEVHRAAERRVRPVLAWLARREILSLLVEGGPALHAAFRDEDVIDRVQCAITPHVLGDGVRGAALSAAELDRMRWPAAMRLGSDTLIEFDVHRPD